MNTDTDARLLAAVNKHRTAAALFQPFKRVTEEFDGKVLNCRYEKALKEAAGRGVFVKKYYKYLHIGIWEQGQEFIIASVELEKMPDGKRIPAALLIDSAREQRADFLKRAAELEAAPEKAKAIKEQFTQISKVVDALRDSLPYEAREIYGLNYALRRW